MSSTPRQAVLRLALAGLFLATTVAARPLHWWLLTAGAPEHVRECRGCQATKDTGPKERGTLSRERGGEHRDHDPRTCAICQFFARGKILAPASPVSDSPELVDDRVIAGPLLFTPVVASPYESRAPPRG